MDSTVIKQIGDKRCFISYQGKNGPELYWPVASNGEKRVYKVKEYIKSYTNKPFTLIAFENDDWNADLSPWAAEAAFGTEDFAGNGKSTLNWLTDECLPEISEGGNRYIGGYSLAGLFSLWSFFETDAFNGAASCSGSLWFPGWIDYAEKFSKVKSGSIYLSLGISEERTKNRFLSKVGDATRRQLEILEESEKIGSCVLEWNDGGHFNDPEQRTAKGFAWLIEHRQ